MPRLNFRTVHGCDAGFVSFLNLFVMLGLLLGISLVANIALVCRDKLESQNAADALTQSAGVQGARGLNAITAANHLIGEAHALVVLHHAWGGDALERDAGYDHTPATLRDSLATAFQSAAAICPVALGPRSADYGQAGSPVRCEAALGDAFVSLKTHLLQAYQLHGFGGAMYWHPSTQLEGIATMQACRVFESRIVGEWQILRQAELAAGGSLQRHKQTLRDQWIPAIYRYSLQQQQDTVQRMQQAAEQAGTEHAVEAHLYPEPAAVAGQTPLRLPLRREPASGPGGDIEKAQLVRAAVPWIIHWRSAVISDSAATLPLSGFSQHYWRHCQELSLVLARRAMQEQGIRLLILEELEEVSGDKGREVWNTAAGSRRADELFSLVGFAIRAPTPVFGRGLYVTGRDDALLTFAQVLLYNANPTSDSGSADLQAVTGWDTLNWRHGRIPEWQFGTRYGAAVPRPEIQLNWQALLVPSTRIREAAQQSQGLVGRILDRTESQRAISRTH